MKLVPINNYDNDHEFYRGTVIREFEIGLNVSNSDEDYYDYMLVNDPSDNEYFILVNISFKNGKAGALRTHIKYKKNTMFTTKNEIIKMLNSKNIYIVEDFALKI